MTVIDVNDVLINQEMDYTRPTEAPDAFHLLAKPTGAICNLDCAYCFFLDKKLLYPDSKFRMSNDILEAYIRQLIESHQVDEVNIAWQGGEPTLMGVDFYRRAIEIAERHKRPGMTFLHTMQTNATLLDDEWCAFLAEQGFVLVRHADPGGCRVADDQEFQRRPFAGAAFPRAGRLGERRDAQVGPDALGHDHGRKADCTKQVTHPSRASCATGRAASSE